MTFYKMSIALFFACYCICHVVVATVPPPRVTTEVVVPPIHPQETIKVCNGSSSDVIFVLDSSGSMGQKNFTVMKEFVKSLINNLEIGDNANHVGVITFSQYPSIRIPLTAYMDRDALLAAIDRIPYISGITETHLALELMRQEGFLSARPYVPHIAIVMTDGKSFDEYKTLLAAKKAHDDGITMFAVGIGMGIKLQELNNIGTDPDSTHVFTVTDFNSLATISNQLSAKTCTVKTVNTTAPPTVPTTTATLLVSPPGQTIEKCNQTVADLVFVLDSSGSVGRDNFNILKQFVMNIVVDLDIGNAYTRVGVITYADYPALRIPLGSFGDKTALLNNINTLPYIPGITETDKALELLMREGFNGGRPSAPNIAIIVTDGLSTHPDYTKTAAQDVKRAGVYMFSVGIGNDTSRTELNQLATLPDPEHVYEVQNFTQLSSIVSSLSTTTCIKAETITTAVPPIRYTTATPVSHIPAVTPSPPSPASTSRPGNESCHGRSADIFFLIDASSSVVNEDFDRAKGFMKNLTKKFHIETSNVRVGAISFSSSAHLEFNLGDYSSTASIQSALDSIIHYQGGTNTGAALELLRTTAVASKRPGVPQVAIVMTDGISRDKTATMVQARLAREANITLVAIGIGKTYDLPELNLIASPDASGNGSYVIEVASFGLLNSITDMIAYIACGFSVILTNSLTPQPGLTTPAMSMIDCKDTIDNCPAYGTDICYDYKPWAMSHCPYHCGFCRGPSTEPAPCVDNLLNCHEYGTYICTSVELTMWTNTNCRKYCAFCGDGSKPTEPSTTVSVAPLECKDKQLNCDEYGGKSVCTNPTYMSWARTHCREYCGFCSNYVDYAGQKVGNVTCPDWHLPKECTLTTVPGSCCPLPSCPDGYKLSAVSPNQIDN